MSGPDVNRLMRKAGFAVGRNARHGVSEVKSGTWNEARLVHQPPAQHGTGRGGAPLRRGREETRFARPPRRLGALPCPGPDRADPRPEERIRSAGPDDRAAIAAAASDVLAGRFGALGRQWPERRSDDLFPAALWRLDPVTGGAWPGAETYAFDIDFRHDGTRGDIKYVWEINRLQFLIALAAEAALGDRREPLVAIEAAIASWHAANPPFRGVGWASGIEVALRAISLILVVSIAGPQLSRHCLQLIGEILAASAFWLPRYPSKYSSANNHLVAELTGEYLLAHALGQATRHAEARLVAETFRQILPDGMPAEQTPTYGAFTGR